MTQTVKAGWKQLILTLIMVVIIDIAGTAVSYFLFPQTKAVGGIVKLIFYCVLAYLVLTRYCATYTYEQVGHKLKIRRQIGKRTKEAELSKKDILAVSPSKAEAEKALNGGKYRTYRFCASILNRGKFVYITFCLRGEYGMAVIEPSKEMLNRIKQLMKKGEE